MLTVKWVNAKYLKLFRNLEIAESCRAVRLIGRQCVRRSESESACSKQTITARSDTGGVPLLCPGSATKTRAQNQVKVVILAEISQLNLRPQKNARPFGTECHPGRLRRTECPAARRSTLLRWSWAGVGGAPHLERLGHARVPHREGEAEQQGGPHDVACAEGHGHTLLSK